MDCMETRTCQAVYRWNDRVNVVPFMWEKTTLIQKSAPSTPSLTETTTSTTITTTSVPKKKKKKKSQEETDTTNVKSVISTVLQLVVVEPKDVYERLWGLPSCELERSVEWKIGVDPIIYLENYECIGVCLKSSNSSSSSSSTTATAMETP